MLENIKAAVTAKACAAASFARGLWSELFHVGVSLSIATVGITLGLDSKLVLQKPLVEASHEKYMSFARFTGLGLYAELTYNPATE